MPSPLHPALVHLPLGLAFVLPLFALAALAAMRRAVPSRAGWLAFAAVAALVLAGGAAALVSGEREEDRVKGIVGEAVLERHEAMARQFLALTALATLLGLGTALVKGKAAGRLLAAGTVLASLAVTASAARVGRAGGELVYEHGAAAVYARPLPPADYHPRAFEGEH